MEAPKKKPWTPWTSLPFPAIQPALERWYGKEEKGRSYLAANFEIDEVASAPLELPLFLSAMCQRYPYMPLW
jgi:hypothetical protein